MKSFKYRIYPTKSQEKILNDSLEKCRMLYNSFVAERKDRWENNKQNISLFDQIKSLPLKKKEFNSLKEVHSTVLQNVAVRVDLAYQGFFRRVKKGEKPGYPRFKGFNRYHSLTFVQYGNGIEIQNGKLKVSKVGNIKLVLHRNLIGIPKTATISKTSTGKWFVIITCDTKGNNLFYEDNKKSIGIDVGIESFATLSDGTIIKNERFFEKEQKKLKKEQRKFSKNKSKKLKKRITRIHERIKNKRHNFCHQVSRKIVKEYSVICIEDLKINKLIEKNWCNKQIMDVAWRQFLDFVFYKAENAGRKIIKINPAYTSQDCSSCGVRQFKKLNERVHSCNCGLEISRDLNAAKNILTLGLQSLGKS